MNILQEQNVWWTDFQEKRSCCRGYPNRVFCEKN